MHSLYLVVALLVSVLIVAIEPRCTDPGSNSVYEGDIRLHVPCNGVIRPPSRWPEARIPYVFDSDVSDAYRKVVVEAINEFNKLTCVRWVPRDAQTDYVQFRCLKTGCWSFFGKFGGNQSLNLESPGCNYKGMAIHQMMHAVGFLHEQNRRDRDEHVRVNLENVEPGKEHYFNKRPITVADTLGVGYDYGSILHYSAHAYSNNRLPTLTPLKPLNGKEIGQTNGFAYSDCQRINRLYNCTGYPQ